MLDKISLFQTTSILALTGALFVTGSANAQSTVVMQKNNTSFSIDGNRGAIKGQQVYLWDTNSNNRNQQWVETSQGGGYVSYKKNNTSLCLDGGNGAAQRQPVTLQDCRNSNRNQHWRKVAVSNGTVRLEKRGTNYSIDGNRGADRQQAIYLWNSNSSNINQQWEFFRSGASIPGSNNNNNTSNNNSGNNNTSNNNPNGDILRSNFNNGRLAPFYECTTSSPNYVRVVNGRVKTYWTEDGYRNNRTSRGAEFCDAERGVDRALGRSVSNLREMKTLKEGWVGFTVNVDRGHNRRSSSALAQVFGFEPPRDVFSWSGLIELNDGNLEVVHRRGRSTKTRGTLARNFEFGRDHDIIVGFVVSNQGRGRFQVWIDGDRVYSATNINFGMGEFDRNDRQTNDSRTTFKLGMYNHSDTDYVNGEERIVYYDNVTWYNGTNGYSVVDPSQ